LLKACVPANRQKAMDTIIVFAGIIRFMQTGKNRKFFW
jgi:hypothetical protein